MILTTLCVLNSCDQGDCRSKGTSLAGIKLDKADGIIENHRKTGLWHYGSLGTEFDIKWTHFEFNDSELEFIYPISWERTEVQKGEIFFFNNERKGNNAVLSFIEPDSTRGNIIRFKEAIDELKYYEEKGLLEIISYELFRLIIRDEIRYFAIVGVQKDGSKYIVHIYQQSLSDNRVVELLIGINCDNLARNKAVASEIFSSLKINELYVMEECLDEVEVMKYNEMYSPHLAI
jgi:hypothetical protein